MDPSGLSSKLATFDPRGGRVVGPARTGHPPAVPLSPTPTCSNATPSGRVRSGIVPRYQLIDENGDDLGPLRAVTRSWAPGDVFARGQDVAWVVVNVTVALADDAVDAYLVVRPSQ